MDSNYKNQEKKTSSCGADVKEIITFFDFFGHNYGFTFNEDETIKSFVGGVIGLCLVLFVIIVSIVQAISFIKRESSQLNYYTQELQNAQFIDLSTMNLGFFFQCIEPMNISLPGVPLPDGYHYLALYEPKFTYYHRKNGGMTVGEKVNYHTCTVEELRITQDVKDNTDLEKYLDLTFCPDVNSSHILEGTYASHDYAYLLAEFKLRDGLDDMMPGLKNIAIENLRQGFCDFTFISTTKIMNFKNYSYPIQDYLSLDYNKIMPTQMHLNYAYIGTKSILIDNNWIFDKSDYENVPYVSGYRAITTELRVNSSTYAQYQLVSSSERIIIERRYKKILDFLAEVTGLNGIVVVVISYIVLLLNNFYSMRVLLDDMFLLTTLKTDKPLQKGGYREQIIHYFDIKAKNSIKKEEEKNLDNPNEKNEEVEVLEISPPAPIINPQVKLTKTTKKTKQKKKRKLKVLSEKELKDADDDKKTSKEMYDLRAQASDVDSSKRIVTETEKNIFIDRLEMENNINKIIANYVYSPPCCKIKRNKYYKQIEKQVFQKFDIRFYLKQLNLVDITTYTLFKDKANLLNYISNPIFSNCLTINSESVGQSLDVVNPSTMGNFLNKYENLESEINNNVEDKNFLLYNYIKESLTNIDILSRIKQEKDEQKEEIKNS